MLNQIPFTHLQTFLGSLCLFKRKGKKALEAQRLKSHFAKLAYTFIF